jgi:ABC-type sugar transport system ATPase subunit
MMVGRSVDVSARPTRPSSAEVVLSVAHLTTAKLRDVSFELHRGEVLGIAGLVGAGRSELGAALVGLEQIHQGALRLHGKPFSPKGPAHAQRQGLGLVPEDRKQQGLMLQMSIQENGTLSVLSRLSQWGILRTSEEKSLFDPMAARLHLKYASSEVPVGALSGGNQQKTLLSRWILADPIVLFLDDPARGIDVAAKEDIYQLIDELAAKGKGILLASSELSELLRCSDRILVLSNGRAVGMFSGRAITQETVMAAATRPLLV